jgi:hypothetical protein
VNKSILYHKFSELIGSLCGDKATARKQAISRSILATRIVFSARLLSNLFIELMGRDTKPTGQKAHFSKLAV